MMIKKIAILGSTGSIGVNALEVVSRLKDKLKVVALSADSNIRLLAFQTERFRPEIISVGNAYLAGSIRKDMDYKSRIVYGVDGLKEIVSRCDIDMVLLAISGNSCIIPLVDAIRNRKEVALANKESLVSAGPIIMEMAAKFGVKIIPVDSEHSAIFQCLEGRERFLKKIYLTGSGGPLLNTPRSRFDKLSRKFILKHPKWRMGKKISVDSATMMNKGLEVIEAKYLFGLDEASIEVVVHPEAIIHSMVELIDGTIFAQIGVPDMRAPIQYAFTYPSRVTSMTKKLDLFKARSFSFYKPDFGKFPCLEMAFFAARKGGTYPAVLSASDEEAVKNFLDGRIKFSDIPRIIKRVLARNKNVKKPGLEDVLTANLWAREETRSLCYR